MTDDPVRLLNTPGNDLLHSLLEAGREEAPGADALRRTLTAVGVSVALSTAASASTASVGPAATSSGVSSLAVGGAVKGAASALLLTVKLVAIGAVTGAVAISTVYVVHRTLRAPSSAAPLNRRTVAPGFLASPQRSAATPTSTSTQPPPSSTIPPKQDVVHLEKAPIPSAARVTSPRGTKRSRAKLAGAPVTAATDVDTSLAAEVATLDNARMALRSGDAAQAIADLDGYELRFPKTHLLPEALSIELEALTLKGDTSSAQIVARRILSVCLSGPHAARARAVLGLAK